MNHFSFNYYGGCSATFRTCAARIAILDDTSKQTLIADIQSAIDKNGGLCKQAMLEMKKLNSFVLEVSKISSITVNCFE